MESKLIQSNRMYCDFRHYLDVVCRVTGEDESSILKAHRYPFSHYRGIIALYLRDAGYTLRDIGNAFNRDHVTIRLAIENVKGSADNPTKRDVYQVWRKCNQEIAK